MNPSPYETPPPGDPAGGMSPAGPPSMVIVIQSQMTLVISLAMLVVGLLVGFLLRPALWPAAPAVVEVTVTNEAEDAAATDAPATTAEVLPTTAASGTENTAGVTLPATPTPDREAQAQELMRILISQVRHFKGDADAPITLIEFSDFQ